MPVVPLRIWRRRFVFCEQLDVCNEIHILSPSSPIVYVLEKRSTAPSHSVALDALTRYPDMYPASAFKFGHTRTHFPRIASFSLVVSGAHISSESAGFT